MPHSSIHNAAATANHNGMPLSLLDTAKFVADVATVIFGVLAASAAVFGLYFGLRLSAAKDAELQKFQTESKVAITSAEARIAEANNATETLRLDVASANERAASANETAEKERLARLQLEARLADRVIADDQKKRLVASFAALNGQTVDVGVFGDNPDIANVSGTILKCLEDAGVLVNRFSPLGGGGGVRGVLIGVSADAPAPVKTAAATVVQVLGETLGNGVSLWDFAELKYEGSAMTGNSAGAAQAGTGPMRIWIGTK